MELSAHVLHSFRIGTYGAKGIQQFRSAITAKGICVGAESSIDPAADDSDLDSLIKLITENKATVIVCFCDGHHVALLLTALKRHQLDDNYTVVGR